MKNPLFLTLLLSLLCTGVRAQCPAGNVVIETDAELAAFLAAWPGCSELNGNLNLQGNVTKTNGLENIVYIAGTLTIRQTPIKDLDGLANLVQVDGGVGLNQVSFQGDLANVSLALENIGGQLVISQNANLEAINALEELADIDEVVISLNPVLTELGGLDGATIASSLSITNNASLSDCAVGGVCNALSLPAADLDISGNPGNCANYYEVLADCTGAACPPNIEVTTNQEITDVTTAFPNCVNLAGNLRVSGSATRIQDFDLLTVGGDVGFYASALNDLDNLEITSIGGNLTFSAVSINTTSGTFTNGPLPLTSVGGTMSVSFMSVIENLASFRNITSLGGLSIFRCNNLMDVSDLQNATFTGKRLWFREYDDLENLDFLDPLQIEGVTFESVFISDNLELNDIDALSGISVLQEVIITNNPELESCAVDPVCATFSSVTSTLLVNNNAVGCNSAAEIKPACFPDLAPLIDLYNATDGANWDDNTGWVDGSAGTNCTPCDGTWYGVICDGSGRVTELVLVSNNLTGTLPASIGNLSQLVLLSLGFNNLTGSIPAEIFTLPRLERLFMRVNDLIGGVPASMGNAPILEQVVLSNNPNLGGTIPASITNITTLESFSASDCGLTGALPIINDGDMPMFRTLVLDQNNLSGNFSGNYGFLTQLERIELNDNNLTGLIPNIFNLLPNLRTLHLENNGFINSLPSSLNAATDLTALKVSGNNFTGILRPNLRDLVNLEIFEAADNGFTGAALTLDQSPNLIIYDVSGNDLSGMVPDGLLNSAIMEEIYLNNNSFTGPLPLFPADSETTLTDLNMANNDFAGCYPTEYAGLCTINADFTGNAGLSDGGSDQGFTVVFCNDNDACNLFPVSWLGFSARLEGKVVNLHWQTALEENNAGFEVERSSDGANWTTLGQVAAGGGDYTFTDDLPLPGNGLYRIKQLDTDGNFSLSQVAVVRLLSTDALAYPNPFQDQLAVFSDAPDEVMVYDANGREVLRYAHLGGGAQVQRMVLKSGVYTIRLRSSGRLTRVIAR